MTKTLVSAAEVVEIAFAEGEYMPAEAISPVEIAAAEYRHIIPVTGKKLYDAMLDGEYPDLRSEYVAPAAAYFTRLDLQPRLDIRTGRFGATVPRSTCTSAAPREQMLDLRKSLRGKARALLRRLSDRLEAHPDLYPEYSPDGNVLNRCTTDGGIVQTF